MPRFPRSYIETSYFHVIVQGINKSYIFNFPEDIKYYIKIMYKLKDECNVDIIAYCIMNNHAHMLLKTDMVKNLSKYMQKINTKYAIYYNKKYNRVGYVFRDRYKSEGIYSEEQLYYCKNYIFNNPVKAKMCSKPEDYAYSNYREDKNKYKEYNDYVFIDVEDTETICKNKISSFLRENNITISDLKDDKKMLRRLSIILKNENNVSLRRIAKELGIGRERLRNIYRG